VHVKIASCVVSYVNPNPEILCVKFLFKTLLMCYTFSSFWFCLVLKCFFIFFRLKNCGNCCKLKSQLTNQFIIVLLTSGFGHWGWSFICCKFKWPFFDNFCALTLLVGHWEEYLACRNWACWTVGVVLSVWCEVQIVCIWFSWCHCIPNPHHLLPRLILDWFYLSATVLPRLFHKRGC